MTNRVLQDLLKRVGVSEPAQAESAEMRLTVPAEPDEDIGGPGVHCDGSCRTSMESWSQPFYYCIVCPNCDLCEDCHSKRIKQTQGIMEETWLSFCGTNHRYIKAPIKD